MSNETRDGGLLINKVVCELCNKEVTDGVTYDIMLSETYYDSNGEPVKTMVEPDSNKVGCSYYVIGKTCCGSYVERAFNGLLVSMA